MDSKFFKNSLGLMKAMKDANLAKITNSVLLDYHRKCHMIYSGMMRYNPPNKPFINSIVDLHDKLVKEMKKRNIKHNTPLKKV
ncbi:MAG: hypothetical protein ACFFG0_01660 [Candidatus Thorarchaeota archaeon]